MDINLAEINYLAVLVAGIAVFFIGGLWYQALFGKIWIRLHNYSEDDIQRMQKRYPPIVFFPVIVAAYLVMSFAISLLVSAFEIESALAGLTLGLILWLTVAAIGVTAHITSERHIGLYVIDTAYQLIIFLVAGAVLGAWR